MNNNLSDFFGGTAFTPATVEPTADFEVLVPGKYPVLIEKAEVRTTKKRDGNYIYLEMQILEGTCKGRKAFDQINIKNPSAQCVEIGMRTLSALGRALGLQAITDTDQLLGGVVIAHVKVKDGQNNVRTYSASGVMVQQAATPALAPAEPPQAPVLPPVTMPPAQVPVLPTIPQQQAAAPPPRPWDKK